MSAREDMFAQVETDLLAIDGTGIYTIDVDTRVEPDPVDLSKVHSFPTLVMIRGSDELEDARGLQRRKHRNPRGRGVNRSV